MTHDPAPENDPQIVPLPPLRVAPLGELNAYVVYEHELDSLDKFDEDLAQDPPDFIFLNFALFLFPISLSFLISLLTTTIRSNRLYELFVIITLLAFLASMILFGLWIRDRRSYQKRRQSLLHARTQQIQKIKSRMPPNPLAQSVRILPEE